MILRVKCGKKYESIAVDPNETVLHLKSKLQSATFSPLEHQKLIHRGRYDQQTFKETLA
jgi:hypothetical protein